MSLLDKMKETAQKGVDKTKEAVSAGQDKMEAHKLEKQISDLKEELGGVVYAQRSGTPPDNADAEIARLVGEIKNVETELAKTDDDAGADAATDTATDTSG
jgi:hypothetical protein